MKRRNWFLGALAFAAVALAFASTRPGYAADRRSYTSDSFSFSIGATPAILEDVEGGNVEADVVNLQSPDAKLGLEVCRVGVTFYDAKGSVLQASELEVGPGETGVARLAPQKVPPVSNAPSPIRVTFQVLDTDGNGRVRPCLAIPSVQIVDLKQLRTVLLVPVLTN